MKLMNETPASALMAEIADVTRDSAIDSSCKWTSMLLVSKNCDSYKRFKYRLSDLRVRPEIAFKKFRPLVLS